jgi:hypothetical protein
MSNGAAVAEIDTGPVQRRAVQPERDAGDEPGLLCTALPLGDAAGTASDGGSGTVGPDVAKLGAAEGAGLGATTGAESPQPAARTPTTAIAMRRMARFIAPLSSRQPHGYSAEGSGGQVPRATVVGQPTDRRRTGEPSDGGSSGRRRYAQASAILASDD